MKNHTRIRTLAVSFLLAFFATGLMAQSFNFAAPTDGAGSSGTESGRSICTDAAGNIYVVGVYNNSGVGNTDFNLGAGVANAPTASSSDGYIASYDKNGNYRWHTYISGTGGEFSAPAGGICTNGTFVWAVGTTTLSGSPVVASISNTVSIVDNSTPTQTGTQALVTKLSCSNGAVNWVSAFGGSTNNDIGQGVCCDPNGCCYIIGAYGGAFTYGSVSAPAVNGTTDLFVAKFGVGGNMLRFMGGGTSGGEMLGAGGGLCYVPGATPAIVAVGSINSGGNATFGSQTVTNTGTSANDGLLLEMDSTLGVSVALVVGSGSANVAEELLTAVYDPFSGGVYVCGYYGGTSVTFPGTTALVNAGAQDAAVARYSVSGNTFTWSRSISSSAGDRAWGVAADGQGGILVSGNYSAAPVVFSGAAVNIATHAGGIGDDIFIAHYNTSGLALWALRAGGTEDDEARGIACYVETSPVFTQNVFTTGLFQTSATFGSTTLTADGASNNDFFVARAIDLATPLSATQSQVNLTCNGVCTGSATVVASGGTSPYTYSWSPTGGNGATASSLCATNFTVTITDATSTSITKTFSITQPPAIAISTISQSNVSCFGGSNGAAQVSASGGTGTLTYNWTPGNPPGDGTGSVTGLTAQVYTVTVTDANSCTATRTFNITAPPVIVVNPVSQTNVTCGGGSNGAASVSASGGNGTLTYNWTPGNPAGDGTNSVTGLTAGSWTCTVTDANSCTQTATFNITAPPAIVVNPVSQTNVSCGGGSNGTASVSASGGTGTLTYNWTPGNPTGDGTNSVTGLTAGSWTCTVTDASSCTQTATFNITAPPAIIVTPVSQTNVSCNGGSNGTASVSASGGNGTLTYNWTPGNPTGDGTNSVTGLAAGSWTCTVTDANSCTQTATFNITAPPVIVVTPVSQTNISCNGGSNGTASVSASGGTGTLTYNWTPGNPTGDGTNSVTGLTAGTWTCTVTDANSCTQTATFNITAPPVIVVTPASQTNVSCGGGSNGTASVSASGGTGTLTYNWTPGNPTGDGTNAVTGLTAGTWTCTVTDANSCSQTATFNITAPPVIVVTPVSQANVSCFGGNNGAASVSASGGTGTLTYNWIPGNPTGDGTNSVSALTIGTFTCIVTDANSCTQTATFNITQPLILVANPSSQNNITCNGGANGSAGVIVSGGTGAPSFNWTPGNPPGDGTSVIHSLTPGSYTCTVTDANLCMATATFSITQPSAISSSITSQTNLTCNGASNGAATVSASGGTGSLSYSWAPSGGNAATATGLSAGTYTCTITDANSCTRTQTVLITQPPAIVASVSSHTDISCNGYANGSLTVSASGGTGSLSYSWAPSGGNAPTASGLSAGTYTCTITDANNCTVTRTATITEPNPVLAGISAQTNVSCNGGSNGTATVLFIDGVGSPTYSWAPSGGNAATGTGLSVGTYTCTVTDANGCFTTVTVLITEPTAIDASLTSQTNVSCNGAGDGEATVTAFGGEGTLTYSWAPSGGNAATASGLSGGTYTCTVTDDNSCTATVTVSIIEAPAISASVSSFTNVSCNGNADGSTTVTASGGTGMLVYSWSPNGETTPTISNLPGGTYTCTINDDNGCTVTLTVTIVDPAAITAIITSQTDASCFGDSNGATTLAASGGTGALTYSWSPAGGNAATASGLTAGDYTVTITDINGCTGMQIVSITEPGPFSAAISAQTNVSCSGGSNGSATVDLFGGVPGFTYAWSPSGGNAATGTGLIAGDYTVTVTGSNGCTATAVASITEPSPISAFISSQTDPTCNGGSNGNATVSASGGTGTLTYAWAPTGGNNPTGTGLAAGDYTVTITDDNGCTTAAFATLNDPPAITSFITAQVDNVCNGGNAGSVSIFASGGTGTLTYNWTPGNPAGDGTTDITGLAAGTYTCTITDANGCTNTLTAIITEPGAITVQMSSTSLACNGGSDGTATADVSGGTPGYSYSWAPSGGSGVTETNLSAGTYTVIVTDANSCIETQTVIVTEPALLTATSSSTPSTCGGNNGTATAAPSGGTGSYNYSWTPSGGSAATATSLASGTYTCTITDANGCVTTTTVIVNSTGGINAFITASSNVSCNGGSNGSATAAPIGGTGPYSYAWTPSGGNAATATGLAAGTYTCTITDVNGCIATTTVSITAPSAIVASVSAQTNISCNGGSNGSATVAASGGTGSLSYAWTPSGGNAATASGLAAGTYTCTITDVNGCTQTQTVNITQPSALSAIIIAQTNVSCNGGSNGSASVAASGGTPAYSYAWTPSGGSAATASGLAAGTYTCVITDSHGCSQTQTVNITQPGAISSAVVGQTNISCNGGNNGTATITASGGTGTLTYNWTPGNPTGDGTVSVSGLAAGTWSCMITDANGCVRTQTVIITQPVALARVMSKTDASCANNDGTATATPSGGTAPYTYAWSPGGQTTQTATALPGGSYTCVITDAHGCTISGSITVNTLACGPTRLTNATCGITLSSLSQQVFCNPVANATNYRYRWINTAQGLNFVFTRNSNQTNCWASWITGIQHGRTYTVEVSAFVGSAWTPYGTVCTVTTPPIVPVTQLLPSDCGSTVAALSELIYATEVPVASKYEWRVSDPAVGFSVTYLRNVNTADLRLQWITAIQYAHTYNVEVRGYVNGDWGVFGAVCTVTTPPFPTTQLTSQYCGATTPSVSSPIYCNAVLNATNYQWKFVNAAIGYSSTLMRGSALTSWYMSSNGGILTNTTYTVTIRAYVSGVWGAYGPPCTITTGPVQIAPNESQAQAMRAQEEICAANPGICDTPAELTMEIYPNPFAENITVTTSPGVTSLSIFNSVGELVRVVTIENGKAELNLGDLASGIYIIQAKTANGVITKRIIKQE